MPDLFWKTVVSGWWLVVNDKKPSAFSRQPSANSANHFHLFIRYAVRFLIMAAILSVLSGCSVTTGPIKLRINDGVDKPPVSVALFLVDGLDRQVMQQLAYEGKLPNIQSRFMDGGVCVDSAVASMPALTYPNLVSAMTGRFPGHHGILGNQWFERSTLQIQDYLTVPTYLLAGNDFDAPTIHEILDEQFTVNDQCPARRGMDRTADNWLLTGADWLLGTYTITDARVGSDVAWVAKVSNEAGKWPVFCTFYFPGVDQIGHEGGSDSSSYRHAVENADRQIGRVIDAIEEARPAKKTYFVLLADHGHIPLNRDRSAAIARCLDLGFGLRVLHAEINNPDPEKRAEELKRYDAIVITSGRRRVAIHLRGEADWKSAPTRAQIDQILDRPACPYHGSQRGMARLVDLPVVACAAHKTPGGARVVTRNGDILIERIIERSEARYRVLQGAALLPAGTPIEFDVTQWHPSRAWLAATADSEWPDFVPQVVDMFDSSRAGDIVVFAADDWALGPGDQGGHGSCVARDMRIPMYVAGPDLPCGTHIRCGRLVDVMPTILDLLGESGRLAGQPPIDGKSLLPELHRASPASRPAN